MSIDVLIPMYNSKETIVEAVQSVLDQTIDDISIIICDDCSTDKSLELVKEKFGSNKSIRIIYNIKNQGYLRTFNKLLDNSTAEYISFLDSDDKIEPKKLEEQLNFLKKNKEVGAVGCNFKRFSETKFSKSSQLPMSNQLIKEGLLSGKDVVCGSSIMIRREVYERIGGYREFFNGYVGEDIDWVSRIAQLYQVSNVSYCGYNYRVHSGSLTRKVRYDVRERHIHDFIIYLINSRENNGSLIDAVDKNDIKSINLFFSKYENLYENHPELLYSQTSIEHAINQSFRMSWRDYIKCFNRKLNVFLCVKVFVLLVVLRIFPLTFLLQLKEYLNIKNISKGIVK